jgi:hypothetical protein
MSLFESASLILTPNGYKSGKLYSIVPTSGNGDLTFTRATSASRTNSSGLIENVLTGVPRLDYSGSTPSILLEPQRTNLAAYSTQFDNGYWAKNNSTISSNLITAPDGTTTADKIVSNLVTTRISIAKTFIVTANAKNTFTLYAKAAEWSRICIFHDGTNFSEGAYYGASVQVNLSTGVSTNSSIAKATSVGNGWYRIETSATPTTTSHAIAIVPLNPNNTDVNAVIGDGVSGVYIWGAQFESGSYATSYIPTTSSTVTRNLDDILKTGVSTDILNPSEGTFYVEISALANDLTSRIISINDGTDFNNIQIQFSSVSNVIRLDTYGQTGVGTTANYRSNVTVTNTTTFHKCLIKWSGSGGTSGITMYVDGVKYIPFLATGTGTGIPTTLNRIDFKQYWGGNPFYGKCKGMQIYKTALTDAECASLTTL